MPSPMPTLPADHPERLALADEVHARPPEPLQTPSRATYVAVLVDAEDRESEREEEADADIAVSGHCRVSLPQQPPPVEPPPPPPPPLPPWVAAM